MEVGVCKNSQEENNFVKSQVPGIHYPPIYLQGINIGCWNAMYFVNDLLQVIKKN